MPIALTPIAWNDAHARQRKGRFQRPAYGPAHVRRLGHLAVFSADAPALEHISFECTDFDDLGMGHMYLKDQGRRHRWGLGRHMHGSQVFDYWYDPADFHVEHCVDGDLVNDSTPTLTSPIGRDTMLQWGHMLVE